MFMAGDTSTNLHTCLEMYREQVDELQGMSLGYAYYTANHKNSGSLTHFAGVAPSKSSSQETTSFSAGCMACQERVVRNQSNRNRMNFKLNHMQADIVACGVRSLTLTSRNLWLFVVGAHSEPWPSWS